MRRKFPYKIDLERRWEDTNENGQITYRAFDGFWYPEQSRHKEAIKWLKEFVGKRRVNWYCNEAGYYHLLREEDAVAFKLRWM